MRAPDFWRKGGLLPTLLSPLAALYGQASGRRLQRGSGLRLPVPVVCVGNLVAGGAGKTPVALSLAEALRARGLRPFFLTRGYKGRLAGPLLVDAASQDAEAVGDEPLLLAGQAPTVLSRDRPAGARLALAEGAEVLIMDDGFQNPSLVKDLSLLVVDAAYGFGNGRVMPAGPLREPLVQGLARADAVVLLGGGEAELDLSLPAGLPCLRARLAPSGRIGDLGRVFAFAGIGRPEKFFASLRAAGAEVVGSLGFPDHHRYTARDLARLRRSAEAAGAGLITTEKDLLRLKREEREGIAVFPVAVVWEDRAALDALLDRLLEGARHG